MARRFSAEVALQRMWNTEESESEEENNSISDGEYEQNTSTDDDCADPFSSHASLLSGGGDNNENGRFKARDGTEWKKVYPLYSKEEDKE